MMTYGTASSPFYGILRYMFTSQVYIISLEKKLEMWPLSIYEDKTRLFDANKSRCMLEQFLEKGIDYFQVKDA